MSKGGGPPCAAAAVAVVPSAARCGGVARWGWLPSSDSSVGGVSWGAAAGALGCGASLHECLAGLLHGCAGGSRCRWRAGPGCARRPLHSAMDAVAEWKSSGSALLAPPSHQKLAPMKPPPPRSCACCCPAALSASLAVVSADSSDRTVS